MLSNSNWVIGSRSLILTLIPGFYFFLVLSQGGNELPVTIEERGFGIED